MEVIRRKLNTVGLPQSVSDMILKAVRPSTSALYNKRWLSFQNWCSQNNVLLLKFEIQDILSHLDFLKKDLNLTAGTIAGHRTAIVTTLEQSVNKSFKDNVLLKQYMKGLMSTATPRTTSPPWDLALIVEALRNPLLNF